VALKTLVNYGFHINKTQAKIKYCKFILVTLMVKNHWDTPSTRTCRKKTIIQQLGNFSSFEFSSQYF